MFRIRHFCTTIRYLQFKAKAQFIYNSARQEVLRAHLEAELKAYKKELQESKLKKDLELFDNFSELFDADLAEKLILMYFTRTKFKHALAFLQFRATLPKAMLG